MSTPADVVTASTQTKKLPIAKAINAGLRRALTEDPKTLVMGEDVGPLGGVFRVTEGLHDAFGPDRIVNTPLAESGIVGTAIGLAMRGYRPILEIQFDGFIFPGYDQITTQLAKMHYRSQGRISLPIVIRVPYGGGIGAVEHHSESPEALFAHTAGLRIVTPSSSQDAYWMIQQAVASSDPVLFFEPKRRYWEKGEVNLEGRVEDAMALHQARVARTGSDLTIAAYGPMVATALQAAAMLEEDGHSIEVVDLRSISPIDFDTIEASVRKTGRLIVTHEAPTFGGIGGEIAARMMERCFYSLEAPVIRVGGFHTPYPAAMVEEQYLPGLERIVDAIDRSFTY